MKKLCYILSYRSPHYVRTRTLISAFEQIEDVEIFKAINTRAGLLRYVQTLLLLLWIRIRRNPEYYLLGFRGYEIFWIVRIVTLGKTLIFDHMMSPYDSLVNEKHKVRKGGILDKSIYLYEKSVLKYSDIILTDTIPHKNYFIERFKISPEKIHTIHVGADEDIFRARSLPEEKCEKKYFNVLFYGSFLPLHGINIVLKAAALLRDRDVFFTIIGGTGRFLQDFLEMAKTLELNNIDHKQWVPFEQLPSIIEDSDICLGGPFGNTGQAQRVITGKTYQALAMAKPVVVGKIGHDYGFKDKENCLLVAQGSERALADSIRWCLENKDKLPLIGGNGMNLYTNKFSIDCIKKDCQRLF